MKIDQVGQWAEVLANVGVIISLILLVGEVRNSTETLRIQAAERRAAALNGPILANPGLADILSKIKSVDGSEPNIQAFVERYNLTYAEATIWVRYLGELWSGLDSEYAHLGPSEGLEQRIRQLLVFPDEVLFLDTGGQDWFLSQDFRVYVASIRAEI